MGRTPCCEKMGMKKGPWTPLEDQILTNYIRLYGHSNWRALPKLAGLLRCGKSCRLRWINYLRPDIKRGNFTPHEEQTIINLHHLLGNRWSAIAAKLPGRTDNEIKNVWHTHLKKRLNNKNQNNDDMKDINKREESIVVAEGSLSPQLYSNNNIEISTVTTSGNSNDDNNFSILNNDESFWSEVISIDNSTENNEKEIENWEELFEKNSKSYYFNSKLNDMEFWFDIFTSSNRFDEFSDISNF